LLVAAKVATWLQLRNSPIYKELGEDVAGSQLMVQDEIVTIGNVPVVWDAVGYRFDGS
jgi:hypothetical protein